MELDENKVFIENTADNKQLVESYNNCVTGCEKPIRDARWETEWQLREFQRNLNDCFYFCRQQESGGKT